MSITIDKERMKFAEAKLRSNCVGTLVYVLGITDSDKPIHFSRKVPGEFMVKKAFDLFLDRMDILSEPRKNSILVMRKTIRSRPDHVGILVSDDLVWHRPGINEQIRTEPLESVFRGYAKYHVHQYYLLSSFKYRNQ